MFAESKRSGNMFNLDINTMRTDDLMKYFKREWNLLRIDTSEMTRVLFVQLLKKYWNKNKVVYLLINQATMKWLL